MMPVEDDWVIESIPHEDWISLVDGAPLGDIVSSDEVTHVVHSADRFVMRVRHDEPPEVLGRLTSFEGERVVVPVRSGGS